MNTFRGAMCFAISVCVFLLTPLLLSQEPANVSGDSGSFSVSGVVVNSVTGEPIPHAVVQMEGPLGDALLCGAEGKFRFSGLHKGQVWLTAYKPGFFSAETDRQSFVTVGGSSGPVLLKLVPEAVIGGHVENTERDPLSNALVVAMAVTVVEGRRSYGQGVGTRTDEDGNFRLANLAQGEYLVSVGPESMEPPPVRPGQRQEQNAGYAPVLYPGVEDVGAASPVKLAAGQHAELVYTLRAQPVFRISGRLAAGPYRRPERVVLSRLAFPNLFRTARVDANTGMFFFPTVPAGTYVARAQVIDGETQIVAEQTVTVAGDIEDLQVALEPAAVFPVALRGGAAKTDEKEESDEETGPQARLGISVSLQPDEWWNRPSTVNISEDSPPGRSELRNVSPGHYAVQFSTEGRQRVFSARCGQTDLLQEKLVVTPGMEPCTIEVMLRDDAAKVDVVVPEGDYDVLLRSESSPVAEPVVEHHGESGKIEFEGVAPGEYSVFVFDRIEGIAYADRETMRKYESKGRHVSVSERGHATVQPEVIKAQ